METKEKIEHFLNNVKTLSFNVKFNNTEENKVVHESFKRFCLEEAGNNYLLGIKNLLDFKEYDYKYASLYDLIIGLREELAELKTKISNSKSERKEVFNTFGGKE